MTVVMRTQPTGAIALTVGGPRRYARELTTYLIALPTWAIHATIDAANAWEERTINTHPIATSLGALAAATLASTGITAWVLGA